MSGTSGYVVIVRKHGQDFASATAFGVWRDVLAAEDFRIRAERELDVAEAFTLNLGGKLVRDLP